MAIDAFITLNLTPAKIVALFPLAISGKLFKESYAIEELFGGRTSMEVFHALEMELGVEEEETKVKPVEDDTVSLRSFVGSAGRRVSSTSSWMREREKNEAGETLEEIAQATAGTLTFSLTQ